jgi:hypothetical protein
MHGTKYQQCSSFAFVLGIGVLKLFITLNSYDWYSLLWIPISARFIQHGSSVFIECLWPTIARTFSDRKASWWVQITRNRTHEINPAIPPQGFICFTTCTGVLRTVHCTSKAQQLPSTQIAEPVATIIYNATVFNKSTKLWTVTTLCGTRVQNLSVYRLMTQDTMTLSWLGQTGLLHRLQNKRKCQTDLAMLKLYDWDLRRYCTRKHTRVRESKETHKQETRRKSNLASWINTLPNVLAGSPKTPQVLKKAFF